MEWWGNRFIFIFKGIYTDILLKSVKDNIYTLGVGSYPHFLTANRHMSNEISQNYH